ncbi:hypothetical protein [Chitinilyticum litopenaei]|nr:hypothetical protein [Chitinilyticum litopenaei]
MGISAQPFSVMGYMHIPGEQNKKGPQRGNAAQLSKKLRQELFAFVT